MKDSSLIDLEAFVPEDDQLNALIDEALDEGFAAAKGRNPSGAQERMMWLREENGASVLNGVPPIGFGVQLIEGVELDDPQSLLAPVALVSPVVNPLFHALMVRLGAEPSGPRSYQVSARKGKTAAERDDLVKNLKAILEVLPGAACYSPNCIEQGEKKGFQSWNISRYKVFRDIYCLLHDTSAGSSVERAALNAFSHDHPTDKSVSSLIAAGEDVSKLSPLRGAAVIISSSKGRVFIRVCTNRLNGEGLFLADAAPDLDRFRPSGRLPAQPVTADMAVLLMEAARDQGYPIVDPHGHLELLADHLRDVVVAQRVPGSPGQSRLVVGGGVEVDLGEARSRLPEEGAVRVAVLPALLSGQAVELAGQAGARAVIDDNVSDVIAMSMALPVAPDPSSDEFALRDYQRKAVGLHAATQVGYLQACSVGLGKTAIALRGMREHALKA